MRIFGLLLLVGLAACARNATDVRSQAAVDLNACVMRAYGNAQVSDSERDFLVRGCYDLWMAKVGK